MRLHVLLVCDSLLKPGVFDQKKFGTTFNVTQFKVGSYKQLPQDPNSAKDISEVFYDNIHLKRRGTAILCGQIKGALRRVFGFTRTVDRQ